MTAGEIIAPLRDYVRAVLKSTGKWPMVTVEFDKDVYDRIYVELIENKIVSKMPGVRIPDQLICYDAIVFKRGDS